MENQNQEKAARAIGRVAVIGCGRWGSLITWYLSACRGLDVTLYGRPDSAHMQRFLRERRNDLLTLPDSVQLSTDLASALEGREVIVISIGAQGLRGLMEELRPLADHMADPPTEFELVTAIGLTWFAREACDIVVCEVGMGGEFDATNVIPAPEAAVLTNIGLDHTKVLGNTVEAIAATKAGIIKPGCHAVLYPCAPSVQEVVAARCRAAGAPLTAADFDALSSVCDTLEGQIFNYGPYKDLRLPLLGGHQLRNAAVALTTIDVLRQRGWHIDESAVRQGLAQTAWPGRFQVVRRQPTIILDGGHNPQCMVSLAAAIREYLPGQPVTVLTGVLADKDYGKMYDQLAPLAARFITVTPHNPRALDAGELAAFLRRYGKPVTACDTIREGVSRMLADTPPDGTAVCCGSLYLLGDVVQSLEKV